MTSYTGIGRYVGELNRGLRATGYGVRVAPLRPPLPNTLLSLGRYAGYDLEAFFNSYPLRAETVPADVTHLTSQTLGLLALGGRMPRPLVITAHDILPYLLRDDPQLSVYRNRLHGATDALAMRGLRRADHLIADSHFTKSTLVDALGIAPERISVVHLGVDTTHYRPQEPSESFRAQYALAQEPRYLLYVGSEDPRKNVPTLLQALAVLRQDGDDVQLLKVGAPALADERERHVELARQLGVADAVRWFDDVPEEDLPHFYNAASVLAFASGYEGFGFPVLEALACGTPVVALRASSVPELVGAAATLIDGPDPRAFAVAIARELSVPSISPEQMLRQASRFTWPATISATVKVYEQVSAAQSARVARRATGAALRPRLRAES